MAVGGAQDGKRGRKKAKKKKKKKKKKKEEEEEESEVAEGSVRRGGGVSCWKKGLRRVTEPNRAPLELELKQL